tara:strand:- start:1359 stop:1757 length:399 start_codon:yes stop_codon:yes gene_type:complete
MEGGRMNEENTHPYDEGGTVSYGTSRSQDILPVFLDTLAKIAKAKGEHWKLADHIYRQIRGGYDHTIPDYIWDNDQSPWWTSEECVEVIEELIGALHDCAPKGYWFGVHKDGMFDYGFWELEKLEESQCQDT